MADVSTEGQAAAVAEATADVVETVVETAVENAEARAEQAEAVAEALTDAALESERVRTIEGIRDQLWQENAQLREQVGALSLRLDEMGTQLSILTTQQSLSPETVAILLAMANPEAQSTPQPPPTPQPPAPQTENPAAVEDAPADEKPAARRKGHRFL